MPTEFPDVDRGEDVDPAVRSDEWTGPQGDQLTNAADVDDAVEALEVGVLSAATESDPEVDSTELADRAAPPAADEQILGAAATPADADHLVSGLPPGVDLDGLADMSLDSLIEAELAAIDSADPETAALIRDEIDRREVH